MKRKRGPLTKAQKERIRAAHQKLEYAVNDALCTWYRDLIQWHGECNCDREQGYFQTNYSGSPTAPDVLVKYPLHLAHKPLDPQIVDRSLIHLLRKLLDSEILIKRDLSGSDFPIRLP
jgi:hypothetical protein